MNNENDKMVVNGNFETYGLANHTGNLTAGELIIRGNFSQHSDTSYSSYLTRANFNATGTHKVIFDGGGTQEISFEYPNGGSYSPDSGFQNVEFKNNNIRINTAIRGFQLNKDTILNETDNLRIVGTLDLNGYTLSLPKGLLHEDGTIDLNGGTLEIDGNYIMGRKLKNDDGEYYYTFTSSSSGDTVAYLVMNNETDKMIVNGNFETYGLANHTDKLTSGELIIRGNFSQHSDTSYSSYLTRANFNATGTHKVIFDGGGTQEISFAYPNGSYSPSSKFQNVIITNKTGYISFQTETYIKNTLLQPGGAKTQNNENVYLQNKSAFDDCDELNIEINRFVGNAENVIPTWRDYENYCKYLENPYTYVIEKISIQSIEETELDAIPDNQEFLICVDVKNQISRDCDDRIIVALYDENGRLLDIKTESIEIVQFDTETIKMPIEQQNKTVHKIKVFIFDSLSSMKPLANCFEQLQ